MNLPTQKSVSAERVSLNSIKSSSYSLFEVGLLIVVIGLFYWFMVQPKKAELATQTTKLEQFQEERDSLSSNLDKLKGLIKKLKTQSDSVEKLDEALPLQGKTVRMEMLLESLVKSSGLTIGSISVSTRNDVVSAGNKTVLNDPYGVKRSLQKMPVSLYVMGDFEKLTEFLKKLEKNSRLMNVTSMEMGSGDEGQVNLKISLEAYYYE